MAAKSFALLACLLLVATAASAAPVWDGQWTDRTGLGLSQYLCTDEGARTFSGLYSEAGVLVGTLSANLRTVRGNWYEAGLGDCTRGTFEFNLAPDGKSFSGVYYCVEAPTVEISVFETRIDSDVPSDAECGRFPRTANSLVNGRFITPISDSTYDMCFQDNRLTGSFEITTILTEVSSIPAESSSQDTQSSSDLIAAGANIVKVPGYVLGDIYENGNVLKFYVTTEGPAFQYSVLAVTDSTTSRSFNFYYWCVNNRFGRAQAQLFDTQCHGSPTWLRNGASPATQTCERNAYLVAPSSSEAIVATSYSYASLSSTSLSSSAASTVAPMAIVMLVAAALLGVVVF